MGWIPLHSTDSRGIVRKIRHCTHEFLTVIVNRRMMWGTGKSILNNKLIYIKTVRARRAHILTPVADLHDDRWLTADTGDSCQLA